MLISETHFTGKSFMRIPRYTVYNTNHPSGNTHGGTAIIIWNSIKHFEIEKFQQEHLQATSVVIEECNKTLSISAVYCPPKYTTKEHQFKAYLQTLGPRFIAGGDYNAKHQLWGSRLITSRARVLAKVIEADHLGHVSTGHPTYWPTDRKKVPDVIDFCITKGIANNYLKAESCLELSSDHSPVMVEYSSNVTKRQKNTQSLQ